MRRKILTGLAVVAALPIAMALGQTPALGQTTLTKPSAVVVEVAKNAGCGCCDGWIARMKDDGFEVRAQNISSDELYNLKISRGLTQDLMACHTATIDGYTVEGHVPVADVRRMLAERPDAAGIVVPGMPIGSPGMDPIGAPSMGFDGTGTEAYDVLLLQKDGATTVYSSYSANG
ncbi:CopG protein [hydrothermal vent metagenome]|uniref:CopG protein n=1 Tax=hydrothermal vent metagenome TaxID=652676 RepID=A0A3B0TH03_9ZZZZ